MDESRRPAPNGDLARNFQKLYLDPRCSKEQIQKILKISRSTFYRLAQDSGIPTVRLGLIAGGDFPSNSPAHWRAYQNGQVPRGLAHDMRLACELALAMQVRFELKFLSHYQIQKDLRSNSLDAGLASMTRLPGRFPGIIFSEAYLVKSKPYGILLSLPPLLGSERVPQGRPRAGVVNMTVHHHFAMNSWADRFHWIVYSDSLKAVESLRQGRIDYFLSHPYYHSNLEQEGFQIAEGPIFYGGSTVVALSPAQENLRRQMNQTLEIFHQRGLLQALENRF